MSSESPKPVSVEDNHTDADSHQTETENKESQSASQSLQQTAEDCGSIEKESVYKNPIKKIYSRAKAYTAKKKANIANWRRNATPDDKNLVVNTSLAMFTGVMTFLTFVLAFAGVYQACLTRKQYEASLVALKATQDSVLIAKQALDEARKSGEEASRVNAQMLETNQRHAAAAQLQAEGVSKSVKVGSITAQAAEKSAGIAQQALIASNRAFVSIDKMRFFKPLEADKPIDLIFEFANDGNNPAEVGGFTVTYISPSLRKCEYGTQPNIDKVVIAPKSPRTQRVNIAPNGISQQWIDAIKDCSSDGLCKRYVQVCIKARYTTLGEEYRFEDCSYYSPGLNAFVACKK